MNRFPDNKQFAFTILDDTDLSTVETVRPIYRLLGELGMRTTKSVWPLASVPDGRQGGSSLQEDNLDLKERGFEISLHNVRNHDSTPEITKQGLEEFRQLLGRYPRVHANHFYKSRQHILGICTFQQAANSIFSLYGVASQTHF